MWINRHKYFRLTGRTARITFAYVVAFPAFIGYWAYTTDVSLCIPLRRSLKDDTDVLVGQVEHERKAKGRYHCRVLRRGTEREDYDCTGADVHIGTERQCYTLRSKTISKFQKQHMHWISPKERFWRTTYSYIIENKATSVVS